MDRCPRPSRHHRGTAALREAGCPATYPTPDAPGLVKHLCYGDFAAPLQPGAPGARCVPAEAVGAARCRRGARVVAGRHGPSGPGRYEKLREAIVAYLAIARGIFCEPRQVFVTAGYQGALGLAARAVIAAGDEVWFEDPGYHLARQGLTAAGARLIPVPVDEEGMRVADGTARAPRARFVVVTPAHQCPLGVALSLPRRLALLAWAVKAGAWIIEDDYDGEFHYC